MHKFLIGVLLALFGVLAVGAVRADPAADKVLACMRANVPPALRVQDLQIDAVDRTGSQRSYRARLFAVRDQGALRAMVQITAPDELAGARYLLREATDAQRGDEMYMYLPAVNRVRRISGADGSFLGTDFSYSDVKQLETAFDEAEARLEKSEQIEQRPVDVILFRPKPGPAARYSQIRAWIDRKTCVALKAEFYEGAVARKQLSTPAAALQQAGSYWYASQAQMRDVKDGTATRLRVLGVTSAGAPASRYFDPHSFYLGN